MKKIGLVLSLVLLFGIAGSASAASFDCRNEKQVTSSCIEKTLLSPAVVKPDAQVAYSETTREKKVGKTQCSYFIVQPTGSSTFTLVERVTGKMPEIGEGIFRMFSNSANPLLKEGRIAVKSGFGGDKVKKNQMKIEVGESNLSAKSAADAYLSLCQ